MKSLFPILLALSVVQGATGASDDAHDNLPSREFGYEVFRHLYRWYLDADQLIASGGSPIDAQIEVWARHLNHTQDPDDRSVYLEILIPEIRTEIVLKKADYTIPELGVTVQNKDFRIALVDRYVTPPAPEADYLKTTYDGREVFDYLYKTRNERVYLDEKTLDSLGDAFWAQARGDDLKTIEGDQIVYIAPLSPVTNDIWVFWESQRKLIKFSSDADYDTEFYWKHQDVGIDVYDFDHDIVVSHSEKPGSNAYITKDVAGRILVNCIVLGQRWSIPEKRAKERMAERLQN